MIKVAFGHVADGEEAPGKAFSLLGGDGQGADAAVRIAQPPRQFVF
ncbi:hypothetical protein GCM10010517_06750 [Streptosporangium fragile]|uniref:Uncharacterized protein n=1 Tax=Streptosporangium fragile TaxID=46186 RepID=A0ABP6I6H5_9ACTN